MAEDIFTVTVTGSALKALLEAVLGPPHYIRELQAIRRLGNSPIDILLNEYNAAVETHNAKQRGD